MNYRDYINGNPEPSMNVNYARSYTKYLCTKFISIGDYLTEEIKDETKLLSFEKENAELLESMAFKFEELIKLIENRN